MKTSCSFVHSVILMSAPKVHVFQSLFQAYELICIMAKSPQHGCITAASILDSCIMATTINIEILNVALGRR